MNNQIPGGSELDKCVHRAMMHAEDSQSVWRNTGVQCHRCGTKLATYYCEERLYMVRCRKCETVTLVRAGNPEEAARKIGVPPKVRAALTRCLYDNVYNHDYWTQTRGICGIDEDTASCIADEILHGIYTPEPCDECTGTGCADCEHRGECITWDLEE